MRHYKKIAELCRIGVYDLAKYLHPEVAESYQKMRRLKTPASVEQSIWIATLLDTDPRYVQNERWDLIQRDRAEYEPDWRIENEDCIVFFHPDYVEYRAVSKHDMSVLRWESGELTTPDMLWKTIRNHFKQTTYDPQ